MLFNTEATWGMPLLWQITEPQEKQWEHRLSFEALVRIGTLEPHFVGLSKSYG